MVSVGERLDMNDPTMDTEDDTCYESKQQKGIDSIFIFVCFADQLFGDVRKHHPKCSSDDQNPTKDSDKNFYGPVSDIVHRDDDHTHKKSDKRDQKDISYMTSNIFANGFENIWIAEKRETDNNQEWSHDLSDDTCLCESVIHDTKREEVKVCDYYSLFLCFCQIFGVG